eukprot:1703700-Rhodomonas_salina.1
MADQIMSERFADTVQQTLVRATYEEGMTTQSREILLGVARELHVYWVTLTKVMSIDSDALPSGTRVLLANFGVNPQFFASVAERITMAAMGSGLDDQGKQKLVDIA